jgi:hypothetical protein
VDLQYNPISGKKVSFRCKDNAGGCPAWDQINCQENLINDGQGGMFRVKSTCLNPVSGNAYPAEQRHKSAKIFVEGYESLKDYLRGIVSGTVSTAQNQALWRFVFERWAALDNFQNFALVNHNLDVNVLHFKFDPVSTNRRREKK